MAEHTKSAAVSTPARRSAPQRSATARLHHLDALRAGALLLGIVLHSVMPFLPHLPWFVEDVHKTDGGWVVLFVIHLFRMSLFMMLAGYFGRMVLQRRGPRAYLRDRGLRIGLPVLVFSPIILVSLVALAVVAAVHSGQAMVEEPAPAEGGGSVLDLLSPAHLWFLLLLFEIAVVVVAVRAILIRLLGARRAGTWATRIGAVLAAPGGMLLAAVPYLAGLLAQGRIDVGLIQEATTIVPVPGASIAYGGAFLVGWFLHAQPGGIEKAGRGWPVYAAVALALTPIAYVIAWQETMMLWGALTAALAGWAFIYALLGICERLLGQGRAWIRYLADASYWMYIVHLPLLLAIEIPLSQLGWPIMVKLVISWVFATVILLASYDLFVRSTWIGAWLNGRRHPRVIFRRRRDEGSALHPAGGGEPGSQPAAHDQVQDHHR